MKILNDILTGFKAYIIIAGVPTFAAKLVIKVVSILGFFYPDNNQYPRQKIQEIKPQKVLNKFPLINIFPKIFFLILKDLLIINSAIFVELKYLKYFFFPLFSNFIS